MATDQQIDIVAKHYVIAAIWADAPEGTRPRATKETLKVAREQCAAFIEKCGPLFDEVMTCFADGYGRHPDAGSAEAAFGHDFWMTRTGAGAGFWDRHTEGLPRELGDKLTELCRHTEPNYCFEYGWFHLVSESTRRTK